MTGERLDGFQIALVFKGPQPQQQQHIKNAACTVVPAQFQLVVCHYFVTIVLGFVSCRSLCDGDRKCLFEICSNWAVFWIFFLIFGGWNYTGATVRIVSAANCPGDYDLNFLHSIPFSGFFSHPDQTRNEGWGDKERELQEKFTSNSHEMKIETKGAGHFEIAPPQGQFLIWGLGAPDWNPGQTPGDWTETVSDCMGRERNQWWSRCK